MTNNNMLVQSTYYFLRIVWVILNNLYCIPVHALILIFSYPIFLISPPTFSKLEETMSTWLLSMVSCWSFTAGYQERKFMSCSHVRSWVNLMTWLLIGC